MRFLHTTTVAMFTLAATIYFPATSFNVAAAQADQSPCPVPQTPVPDVIPNSLPPESSVDEAVNAFYTAYEQRQLDTVANSYSDYSIKFFNATSADIITGLKKDDFNGYRQLAHLILKKIRITPITYMVAVQIKYSTDGSTLPSTGGVQSSFERSQNHQGMQSSEVDLVLRLENGKWKINAGLNDDAVKSVLVDYYLQVVKSQTINGVIVQPERVVRYNNKLQFVFCLQNMNSRKLIWTWVRATAGTFFFPDQTIDIAGIFPPVKFEGQRTAVDASLNYAEFSANYPTEVDLRSLHIADESGSLPSDYGAGFTFKFKLNVPQVVIAAPTVANAQLADTIGVYSNGTFNLRSSNTTGDADLGVQLKAAGKPYPLVGDWSGTGVDTVGLVDQNSGGFTLCRMNDTASCAVPANLIQFIFGSPNDQPIAGRWQAGATADGIGVFRAANGFFALKNAPGAGNADVTMMLGVPGDVGIVGDWTGKGYDSPGMYRRSTGTFALSNQLSSGKIQPDLTVTFQIPTSVPGASDIPIVGDWIGQGHDSVGLVRQNTGNFYLSSQLASGTVTADLSFTYGSVGNIPVSGHWSIATGSTGQPH